MTDAGGERPSAGDTSGAVPVRSVRRKPLIILVAAVACVAAVISLAVYLHRRSGVRAGSLFELRSALAGSDSDVELPVGSLDFTVSRPLAHLPASADPIGRDRRDIETVHGFGRYIGVSWTFQRSNPSVAVANNARQFTVSLVADDRTYDLRAAVSEGSETGLAVTSKSVALAVPGNPGAMSLLVAYDGLTQTLTLPSGAVRAGVEQPYYSSPQYPTWGERGAEFVRMKAPGFQFDDPEGGMIQCTGTAAFTSPYVDGPGWAEVGRTWLVVPFATSVATPLLVWPRRGAARTAFYNPRLTATTVLLDRAAPVAVENYYLQGPAELMKLNESAAYYVFEIPASSSSQTLTFHQDYVDSTSPTDAPAGAPRSAHATVDLTLSLRRV